MTLSPEDREVMRTLGITEGQWMHYGCAGDRGGIRAMSAHHSGLIALQAPSRLAQTGELPARILMMKWGENETAEGIMTVGLKTLQASTVWDSLGFGQVAIDFNHNTVPGHPSYQGEPAPIAAMATPRVIEDEGLVFDDIIWTDEGRKNRQHYPDLSPAIKLDDQGEVIFCHSGALARNGAVKDLHLCAASALSPDLVAKLLTLSAFSSGSDSMISTADREVMRVLEITPERWIRAQRL